MKKIKSFVNKFEIKFKLLNKKVDYLDLKKSFLFYSILFSIYLIFRIPILEFNNHYIVNPILSKIEDNIFLYFGSSILLFLCLKCSLNISKNKVKPLEKSTILWCFIFLIYLSERFFFNYYQFLVIQNTGIAFFDIMFIVLSVLVVFEWTVYFISLKKSGLLNNDGFLVDLAKKTKEEDDLGYYDYAVRLAHKIKLTKTNKAFAIGVNAKWGYGKTTFLSYLDVNFKNNNEIIKFNFNPWACADPKDVIREFFISFQNEISGSNKSLFKKVKGYSDKLLGERNLFSDYLGFIKIFQKTESIHNFYYGVNKEIGRLDKKIIIFIDDVDRLKTEEVFEVLKLVRNTANFQNTFFIMAYNREYVINSIKKENETDVTSYLDKIVQFEVNLPYFEKSILIERFKSNLKDSLNKRLIYEIERINTGDFILKSLLNNMRDVVLLSNSLSLNIDKLLDEVDFHDFIKLELLRLKFPSVYKSLSINYTKYLKNENNTYYPITSDEYKMSSEDEFFRKFNSDSINAKNLIRNAGDANKDKSDFLLIEESNLEREEINIIKTLLKDIFSLDYIDYDQNKWKKNKNKKLSIANPSIIKRYFRFTLLKTEFSNSELKLIIDVGYSPEKLNRKIEIWKKQNKLESAIYHLNNISVNNLNSYKSTFYLIYKIGEISYGFDDISSFRYARLKDLLLLEYREKIEGNAEALEFVKSFFLPKTSNPLYASYVLRLILSDNNFKDNELILKENDLTKLNSDIFKSYLDGIEKNKSSIFNVFGLYHNCKVISYDKSKLNQKVLEQMKEYFSKDGINELYLVAFVFNLKNDRIYFNPILKEIYHLKKEIIEKVGKLIKLSTIEKSTLEKLKEMKKIGELMGDKSDVEFRKITEEEFPHFHEYLNLVLKRIS
jgi:predicted KAP-like P-loop ATPase